jgi:PST family polysaccharide transporter
MSDLHQPWGRIFSSASWYLAEKFIRLLSAFFIGALVARYLGPGNYGTLSYSLALISTLSFLGSWGIESLVVRDLVHSPQRQQQVISTYFFVRLGGALLVPPFSVAYLLVFNHGDVQLLWITLILSSTVLLAAMDSTDCWLQAHQRARTTSVVRLAGFASGVAVKVALVIMDAGLVWFAIASVVESAFIAGLYASLLRRENVHFGFAQFDSGELRRLMVDGRLMILSGLTVIIYSKVDILSAGALLAKDTLGMYAMAATMVAAWNMVGTSLVQAWAPQVSLAHARGEASYVTTLRRLLATTLLLSLTGSLAMSLLSPWIFDLLLGPSYARSAGIFAILVWSSVPVFLGVATSQIIVNNRIYWVSLLRTALGVVVILPLIVPATRHWQSVGVAWLVLAGACVATSGILLSQSARRTLAMTLGLARSA